MRPTAKDLAEEAGVSLATVDRVLNERPNVSKKAHQKVAKAIDKLGFVRNLAAVNLARNKTYKFRFIVPDKGDQYLQEILKQVDDANQRLKFDLSIVDVKQIAMADPHKVANYLGTLNNVDVDGVALMAPESPQVRDAMIRMSERGINVVQFLSGQEKVEKFDFIGIDNFSAGATAGQIIGRFTHVQSGKIMVISDTMQSLDSIQRRLGFDDILNSKFPHLTALPSLESYGNIERARRIITRQFEYHLDIVALYVLSSEARIAIEQVVKCRDLNSLTTVVHERTPFSEKALQNEQVDAVIAQNPGHAVRGALRILRARCENREPNFSQEKIRIEVLLKENL